MPQAPASAVDQTIPAHVPPQLVVDFDIYGSSTGSDDYLVAWSRLQQELGHRVIWTPRNGGHWIARRFEIIAEIAKTVIHVKTRKGEYGPVEDAHMFLDHLMGSYFNRVVHAERGAMPKVGAAE